MTRECCSDAAGPNDSRSMLARSEATSPMTVHGTERTRNMVLLSAGGKPRRTAAVLPCPERGELRMPTLSRNAQVLRYLLQVAPGIGHTKLAKFAYLAD